MGTRLDYSKSHAREVVARSRHKAIDELPFSGRVPDEVLIEAEWPDGITLGVLRTPEGKIVYGRWDNTKRWWTYRLTDWQRERVHDYWLLRRDEALAERATAGHGRQRPDG